MIYPSAGLEAWNAGRRVNSGLRSWLLRFKQGLGNWDGGNLCDILTMNLASFYPWPEKGTRRYGGAFSNDRDVV